MRPIPLATYRLQLTSDFGFDAASSIVPYLSTLGISHVYASPFLKSRRGSTHGYDIVDHNAINPELGGEEAFERFTKVLRANDMGLILDFVPNHMGVHFADNAWWLDVLEWGKSSPYAKAFDIDWETLPFRSQGGVLVPILGTSYGEALSNGQIELKYDPAEGSFSAWYFEHRLPITPTRYSDILLTIHASAATRDPAGAAQLNDLQKRFRGHNRPTRKEAPELKALIKAIPPALIEEGLRSYAVKEDPSHIHALHSLLERQHYRLGHWRLATSEINYRRFFDVNSLAGLRVEEAMTFDGIHRLVGRLIADGKLQGLRLDHIDGLRDPTQYCQRLARLIKNSGQKSGSFYVLVEKILGSGEPLPSFAGVHGTTGYEWLNIITQVLIDQHGMDSLAETWRQVSNIPPRLEPILRDAKRRVLETLLASEFTVLSRLLARIAAGQYSTRDFSADSLRQALELYVLHFPVYRTYITGAGPSPDDRRMIEETIERARAEWFGADDGLFDFLRSALTLDLAYTDRRAPGTPRIQRFVFKVQQFTGPMMAKSLEDTAFYRFYPLLALNEVGGEPLAGELTAEKFHSIIGHRQSTLPHGMTTTATHDTKRGEDARARLVALTELASEWTALVAKFKTMNAPHISITKGIRSPSTAFEYFLYQSLLGAWEGAIDDSFVQRIKAFAVKAAREAKLETSWLNPYEAYERGLEDFVDAILDRSRSDLFIQDMNFFALRTALLGALNSLSQITLKTMMTGVPDFYQGTELWDLSLVDPDNRRPVDFDQRCSFLKKEAEWRDLTANWQDGRLKMAWTKNLLRLRNQFPELFQSGTYVPIEVTGPDRHHIVAFAREYQQDAVIVAVGKHFSRLTDGGRHWPDRSWNAELNLEAYVHADGDTGAFSLGTMFPHFPAAAFHMQRRAKSARKAAREHGRAA